MSTDTALSVFTLRCCTNFHTARVLNIGYKALSVPLITPTHRTLRHVKSNSSTTLHSEGHHQDVQMARWFCGVFAIAFATALANGKQPVKTFFRPRCNENTFIKLP